MGCGSSGSYKQNEGSASPEVLEAYLGLEQAIWREEQQAPAPAPALSFATARLEALTTELQTAEERVAVWSRSAGGGGAGSDESMRQVVLELGLHRNEARAAEHEEFVANINRQALARNEVALLERRREEAEEEVKVLTSKVAYLQGLYQEEDALLSGLFGEAYGSDEERHVEVELDRLRSYRDTLAGGEMEWREAVALVQSATELLDRALVCWKQIDSQTPETRFHLSTETRNCLQEAALSVQMAQAMLPGVQFPYCTAREIHAVLQAVVYMFTDIQIADRYHHAGQCYRNFQERAKALAQWMQETIEKSLRKDVDDVDARVGETTERLRRLRVSLIRHKMGDYSMEGLMATPPYGAPGSRRIATSERRFNGAQALRPAFDARQYKMASRREDMWQGPVNFNARGEWGPTGPWGAGLLGAGAQVPGNNGAAVQIPGQWSQ
ncbi:uncharacterized protein synr [Periplaneta americana]|uniref:uncharacterized protein synr n=1 Tax=Periplaneta americana TaxID=6978 RepID=UPI0037E7C4DC